MTSNDINRKKTISEFFTDLEDHGIYRKKFTVNEEKRIHDDEQSTLVTVHTPASDEIMHFVNQLEQGNTSSMFDGMSLNIEKRQKTP